MARKNGRGNQNRIIKFSIVGTLGIFTDEALLFVFTDIFGLFYILSSLIAKESSLLQNFSLNEKWTFRDRRENGSAARRLLKFNLISVCGILIAMLVLFLLTSFFGIYYLVSNLFGIFCGFSWNYFVNKRYTWKTESTVTGVLKPMKSPKVSLVIPTYNEEENIGLLIPQIFGVFSKNRIRGEVIVVDDNSPDGTGKIVLGLGKKYNVKLVRRPGKLGLSSAFLEGYRHASGGIVGIMDADMSHPAESLPGMIRPIIEGEADFVIGSRRVSGGGMENWPIRRRIISSGAALLARGLTGVKDPMSGFFFARKEVIDPEAMSPEGFKICLEVIVKGKYSKVVEMPYTFRDRRFGKSKLGASEVFRYLKHAIKLYWYKANSPL
jgi:putative flippase GtrA